MRKFAIVVAIVAFVACAATAYAGPDDDWIVYIRASSPDNSKALTSCAFGTEFGYTDLPAAAEDKAQTYDTYAPVVGGFDLGTGSSGTGYYQDLRSPVAIPGSTKTWTIKLYAGTGYRFRDIVLSAWNPASNDISGAVPIRLVVVHDPTGAYADGAVLIDSWSANANGTQALPAYSWTFLGAGLLKSASNPIILQLSANYAAVPASPEPGGLVAMLSGLAGIAGYVVRRRR